MSSPATLADAGPLIALLDEDDPHHSRCVAALKTLLPPLVTTWPVIAEAMYRLGQINGIDAQKLLRGYVTDGLLEVVELDRERQEWMQRYMVRYGDRPCDLADASLLAVVESSNSKTVFTIDSDFYIYVLSDGSVVEVIPGPMSGRKSRR